MKAAFQQVLDQAIEDEAFSRKLQESPDETLKPYSLSAEEIAALKGLSPQLLQALRQQEKATVSPGSWWKPTSFRETGAAVLSVMLILLMGYSIWITLSLVNAVPLTYTVGENVQVIDTFDRAKDMFNILFPLFGAVVTFWLGVTVEGRRADRNEAEADKAKIEKETAQTQADKAKTEKEVAQAEARDVYNVAVETLAEVEEKLLEQAPAPGSGFERANQAGGAASADTAYLLATQNALNVVRAGRQKLKR